MGGLTVASTGVRHIGPIQNAVQHHLDSNLMISSLSPEDIQTLQTQHIQAESKLNRLALAHNRLIQNAPASASPLQLHAANNLLQLIPNLTEGPSKERALTPEKLVKEFPAYPKRIGEIEVPDGNGGMKTIDICRSGFGLINAYYLVLSAHIKSIEGASYKLITQKNLLEDYLRIHWVGEIKQSSFALCKQIVDCLNFLGGDKLIRKLRELEVL